MSSSQFAGRSRIATAVRAPIPCDERRIRFRFSLCCPPPGNEGFRGRAAGQRCGPRVVRMGETGWGTTLLRIRDWERNFETHESRKLKRLGWVGISNDLLDIRYRTLWIAIVEVASVCKVRGTLCDSGVMLTARHMAMKSGIPEAVCALLSMA